MATITNISKNAKQPPGGYLPLKKFNKKNYNFLPYDGKEEYNINPGLVGNAVDYGSRLFFDTDVFVICKDAANKIGSDVYNRLNKEITKLEKYIQKNKEYDKKAVTTLCNIVYFDIVYRTGKYREEDLFSCEPDDDTAFLINLYIQRTLLFFKEVGPVCAMGFTFEDAFTQLFTSGEGDFLTRDTIWDLKVLKNNPNTQKTLQVACYYVAALQSNKNIYKNIKGFGIFNPRKNTSWEMNGKDIDEFVLWKIKNECLGYSDDDTSDFFSVDLEQIKEKYAQVSLVDDIVEIAFYIYLNSIYDPLKICDSAYCSKNNIEFIHEIKYYCEVLVNNNLDVRKLYDKEYITKFMEEKLEESFLQANKGNEEMSEELDNIVLNVALIYFSKLNKRCKDEWKDIKKICMLCKENAESAKRNYDVKANSANEWLKN